MIFYEVLDLASFAGEANPLFGSWFFDIDTVIAHRGCPNTLKHSMEMSDALNSDTEDNDKKNDNKKQNKNEEVDDKKQNENNKDKTTTSKAATKDWLKGVRKGMKETAGNSAKKKKQKTSPGSKIKDRKTPSSSPRVRFPPGFSIRNQQRKGRRPTCPGCGEKIDYAEMRVCHNWTKPNMRHPERQQYHAHTECLKELDPEHLDQFLADRKLTMNVIRNLKKEIAAWLEKKENEQEQE